MVRKLVTAALATSGLVGRAAADVADSSVAAAKAKGEAVRLLKRHHRGHFDIVTPGRTEG